MFCFSVTLRFTVMYLSLKHGVNLSRRACRLPTNTHLLIMMLVLLSGVGGETPRKEEPRTEMLQQELAKHEDVPHQHIERYKIMSFDFGRIEAPFLIALWIFCASLAKIGKFKGH